MKRRRFGLRWQLLLSYLPVILAPIVVTGLVVQNVAEQSLTVLVSQEAHVRALALSGVFTQYYSINGSWTGVETLFDELRPTSNQFGERPLRPILPRPPQGPPAGQIFIVDNSGRVIASDDSSTKGQVLSSDVLSHGAMLTVNGKQIGTLVIGTAFLDEQGKQLLDSVSSALLLTGLLTSVGAVGLALWLSGQLTAPVHDLLAGVKQLANGRWSQPLAIRSQNEFADLTDAFNGMAEQLTHQQKQQRQMIADIAHDLRTPLSVIDLELEGIRSGLQSPEEATQSLQEEVNWLQHLIDDLHTLSLMDTGQFTLNLDDTALTPYLASLCEQWQPMAVKHDKTLTCDVPDNLPVVAIDPFRLRQVLGNLLNNALQHTPAGTQIRLCAHAEADQVEISVADKGTGIAPEDLAHVFDRFYRADRARNRGIREHGSGLGLSIAQQLMQLHGGSLTVESVLGKETTFHVRLPILLTKSPQYNREVFVA